MNMLMVTAGIIEENGKFLIAKRKDGDHLANKWEFPGGKIEDGETPEECLKRELNEEFGIETEIGEFVGESQFRYPNQNVTLLGYIVRYISGDFQLNAHKEMKWVKLEDINQVDFANADIPIIEKLKKRIILKS